jgi:glycosyltransferase involved in cell wall biosynthesis
MKILWISPNFLHPTTKGGQIRTLETLRALARRHEIHYVAYRGHDEEGPARSFEYCYRSYPVDFVPVDKRSPWFAAQAGAALFSPVPLAISRFRCAGLRPFLQGLIERERFDRIVEDFLVMAGSSPEPARTVLFQHNVETVIWRRRAEHARDPFRGLYLRSQARRMFRYERAACQAAGHVIAVSPEDAGLIRELFAVSHVSDVPTGVDLDYFARPPAAAPVADLVFVGSLDWAPNVDAVFYFLREILPRIRRHRPETSFAVVGRTPPAALADYARKDGRLLVTGTVPDVRSYLWGSAVAVVPLRCGSGTRLKIYEAIAAGVPVVSTAVGAEGLALRSPDHIRLADQPDAFAARCLELLESEQERRRLAAAAWELVAANFSWDRVADRVAELLESIPAIGARSRAARTN